MFTNPMPQAKDIGMLYAPLQVAKLMTDPAAAKHYRQLLTPRSNIKAVAAAPAALQAIDKRENFFAWDFEIGSELPGEKVPDDED